MLRLPSGARHHLAAVGAVVWHSELRHAVVCQRERIDAVLLGEDDSSLVLVEQQLLEDMLCSHLPLLFDEIERQEDRVLQLGQGSPHLQIEGVSWWY